MATEAYAVCARRTERRDVHVAEALGGAAEGSYEQEAAVVEEDEEMEREDENEGWRSGQTSTSWMCRNGQNWHWIN